MPPDRIMDAIGLRPGMTVGEAGAWYGYYTFHLSRRVGPAGQVYANDINPDALRTIQDRCAAGKITNIKTVLGVADDPRYPRSDLDLILVGDCLHMFEKPVEWMANARKYLKPGGRLVIVDPDSSKMTASRGFLSKRQVWDFAKRAGYTIIEVDDGFLKNHMIIILQKL
jgi:ubiquinone/menaquinone biosynthesis C-methylase UbiE